MLKVVKRFFIILETYATIYNCKTTLVFQEREKHLENTWPKNIRNNPLKPILFIHSEIKAQLGHRTHHFQTHDHNFSLQTYSPGMRSLANQ